MVHPNDVYVNMSWSVKSPDMGTVLSGCCQSLGDEGNDGELTIVMRVAP